MKFRQYGFVGALAALVAMGAAAVAQLIPPVPTVTTVQPTDLIPDAVGGAPGPSQPFVSALTLAGYTATLPYKSNILVGGDGGTNLFQRATTGSSVTTTVTYGGPDRWAYWSGTNTAMTVSQDTTAADLRPSTKAAFKMARTSGQTGVVQMCMLQEIETVNSIQFQGQVAELDFEAITGANFSPASGNVTAYIITGTGTDQGVAGTASVANGLNSGGGGSGTWTGQANATAAVISLGGTGTTGRYAAFANIPSGATEIAVALCMTPVGTAGTNDYVAFQNIQLVRNPAQAAFVSATVGYACSQTTGGNAGTGAPQCAAFDRRAQAIETLLQQRYYYQITDNVANTVPVALCQATTTAAVVCVHQFPVPMRAAPTAAASATTAFSDTATAGSPTACTAFAIVASSTTTLFGKSTCTTGATVTAGGASQLTGANTAANVNFSAEL